MTRSVAVLGSTGSIGTQCLDVIREHPRQFDVVGLSAHSSVELLKKQCREFNPELAGVTDESAAPVDPDWLQGPEALEELVALEADIVVLSVVGTAGLEPCLKALENGSRVALANKEVLVMAGQLVEETEEQTAGEIIPVDSEHSALYQLLEGEDPARVNKMVITASGGPFLDVPREELSEITPAQALDHPNWEMGNKITIDSATMMNKGLEVIEACYLFDLEPDKIRALIHPQSAVHGLVEYVDNSLFAQCAVPDMRLPIQYALFYPHREPAVVESLSLDDRFSWEFEPIDSRQFPAYGLARRALAEGKTYPAVLNAANEVAVYAFLEGKIDFLDIPRLVEQTLDNHEPEVPDSLETILRVDADARRLAREKTEDMRGR